MTDTASTAPASTGPRASTQPKATSRAKERRANGVPWQLLFWAAIGIAVVYVVFALLAYSRADDVGLNETVWSRSVLVLKGIEAIAFTAIGWLFGREVNRGEAQAAKEHASDARQQAEAAKQQAKEERTRAEAAEASRAEAREAQHAAQRDGWRLAERIRGRTELAHQVTAPGAEGGDETVPTPGHGKDRGLSPSAGGRSDLSDLKDLADRLFPPS